MRPQSSRDWLWIAVTPIGYVLLARACLLLLTDTENVSAFWPPSGFLLGILLVASPRIRVSVACASVGVGILADFAVGKSLAVSTGYAVANLIGPYTGLWCIERMTGNRAVESLRWIGALVLGSVCSAVSSSVVGAATTTLGVPETQFLPVAIVWASAVFIGSVITTPLVIALAAPKVGRHVSAWRVAEAIGGIVLLGAIIELVRMPSPHWGADLSLYAVFPLLILAAMRFGMVGAASSSLLIAFMAIRQCLLGVGPFSGIEPSYARALGLQVYLSTLALSSLVLACAVQDRQKDQKRLQLTQTSVDRSAYPIFWISKAAQVVYANQKAADLTGYTINELVGMSIFQLGPDYDQSQWKSDWERLEKRKQATLERTLLTKAGIAIPIEFSPSLLQFDATELFVVSVRDLRARDRILHNLRESEHRYRELFEQAADAIVLLDPEGKIAESNQSFDRMLGQEGSQIKGTAIDAHVLGGFAPEEPVDVGAAQRPIEVTFVRIDGGEVHTEITQKLLSDHRHLLFIRDITDRKKAFAALFQAETQFSFWINQLPAIFWTTDQNLVFQSSRGAGLASLGLVPDQVVGMTVDDYAKSTKNESAVVGAHSKALKGESSHIELVWSGIPFVLAVEPLRDEQSQIIGTLGIAVDISERKAVESRIQQINEELERMVELRTSELKQAISELESFSYSVSHDLRGPLRAISGYALLVQEDYSSLLPEDAVAALERIRVNSVKMSQLIDDLLTFSRTSRQPLIREPVVLSELFENAFEELHSEKSSSIFETACTRPVSVDAKMFLQVARNLISNALKFKSDARNTEIEFGCIQADGETRYFLRDNGIGFDQKYADQIFGVFSRLHSQSQFEGTGVGLAIVQRIISRHGGRIWAESELGTGTTIWFTLEEPA